MDAYGDVPDDYPEEDFFDGCNVDDFYDDIEDTEISEKDVQIKTDSPSSHNIEILQRFFGYSSFRPMQWRIIQASLQGCDNCVIMSTGYGKSLCYQYPAVYMGGVSVVVSPLISLMEDQVLALKASNIDACFLGSAQMDKGNVYSQLLDGQYRVVYVTPEFVDNCIGLIEDLNKKQGITLFAIDEAHCVSQWGHDFRVSYRRLGNLRQKFQQVPIMALTATATPKVQQDIAHVLRLRNPVITITDFDRPNLYIEVKLKGSSILEDILPLMIKNESGSYSSDGSTIIYCGTKKSAEEVTCDLKSVCVECAVYHAGLSPSRRKRVHENFVRDHVSVIVATIAFGMGINKPDVRRVIHYGAPRDLESYYQEIGRAGRDGLSSVCTVFYDSKDFALHKYFIGNIKSHVYQKHKMELQQKMEQFLSQTSCFRYALLSHFTSPGKESQVRKDCCSNCTNLLKIRSGRGSRVESALDNEGKYDFTEDAVKLIKTVKACGENCGFGTLVLVMRGSNSQRVKPYWKKMPVFGTGKNRSEGYWKALGKMLVFSNYLNEVSQTSGGRGYSASSFAFTAIQLTPLGRKSIGSNSQEIKLVPSSEMKEELRYVIKVGVPEETGESQSSLQDIYGIYRPKLDFSVLPDPASRRQRHSRPILDSTLKPEYSEENIKTVFNPEEETLKLSLYLSLKTVRNRLAEESGFMPYMVASDKTLLTMARSQPLTLDALKEVDGMTEAKIHKFGEDFIRHIQEALDSKRVRSSQVHSSDSSADRTTNAALKSFRTANELEAKQSRMTSYVSTARVPVASTSGWLSTAKAAFTASTQPPPASEGSQQDSGALTQRDAPLEEPAADLFQDDLTEWDEILQDEKLKESLDTLSKVDTYAPASESNGADDLTGVSSVGRATSPIFKGIRSPNAGSAFRAKIKLPSSNDSGTRQCQPQPVKRPRKGVLYDSSGSDSEAELDHQKKVGKSDPQKYERIIRESKEKLRETRWIDPKKMKSRMKKNSLFVK